MKTPKVHVVSLHNVMINFHDCSKVAPRPLSVSRGSTTPLLQKIILYEHNYYRLSFSTSFNNGSLYTLLVTEKFFFKDKTFYFHDLYVVLIILITFMLIA